MRAVSLAAETAQPEVAAAYRQDEVTQEEWDA